MSNIQSDTNKPQKHNSATYEKYLIQDLEQHRVFVDIDVFMKHVLHVPDNWEDLWGPIIERIKRRKQFWLAHWDFTNKCDSHKTVEEDLYRPLVRMNNAILDVCESSKVESVKPAFGVRYLRNDPRKILNGKMNNLSPDVVAVHKDILPWLDKKDLKQGRLGKKNLTWAHPLQTLEVKPFDAALVDGSHMPRLKANGKLQQPLAGKLSY